MAYVIHSAALGGMSLRLVIASVRSVSGRVTAGGVEVIPGDTHVFGQGFPQHLSSNTILASW